MKVLRILGQCLLAIAVIALLKPFMDSAGFGGLLIGAAGVITGSRQIDAPDYPTAAQTGSITRSKALPRESLLSALLLRFDATFNVTGGTAAGTIYSDATFRWFKRININSARRKLWSITGQAMNLFNTFWQNAVEIQDPPSNDTAGLSETVQANLHLPFYMPYSHSPHMLALATYAFENLSIEVEMDTPGAAVNAEDGTIDFTNGVLKLFEEPIENLPKHPANRYGVALYNDLEYAFTVSESQHKFFLNNVHPNEEIRAVLIEAFDTGTTGGQDYEYSDAIADEVVFVVNGVERIQKTPWTVLQDRNVRRYGLSARKTGVVLIDAAEDKSVGPGDLWVVRAGMEPYVQLKLTFGTTSSKVRITTMSILRSVPQQRRA